MTDDTQQPTVACVVLERLFVRATNEYKEPGEMVELPAFTASILSNRGSVVLLPEKPKRGAVFGEIFPYHYTGKAWQRVTDEQPPDAEPESPDLPPINPSQE